ncbi:MAG: UPF0149 family protein [Gammaproteobacteria bacterium]
MTGSIPARTQGPAFAELQAALDSAGALVGAAQCHGLLCGTLCAGTDDEAAWLDHTFGTDASAPRVEGALAGLLHDAYAATVEAITGEDFDFAPMLPDDDEALGERVAGLREWCAGFLYGFGVGAGARGAAMSPEAGEFVGDLDAFTRLDGAALEGEENENAFMELVEYVKVGVLSVYYESHIRH